MTPRRRDSEKAHEAIKDAGLAKILRRAKDRDSGAAGISRAETKRRLGFAAGPARHHPSRQTARRGDLHHRQFASDEIAAA